MENPKKGGKEGGRKGGREGGTFTKSNADGVVASQADEGIETFSTGKEGGREGRREGGRDVPPPKLPLMA